MHIEISYPVCGKRQRQRRDMLRVVRWPVLAAVVVCPILNLFLKGPAWSVIVLWSLWMVWDMVLSPDLVEYNRISQFIKLVTDSCILMLLIDWLLAPGWVFQVVPIVCFSALIVVAALFFTDLGRQRQNMLPMLLLIAITLLSAAAGLIAFHGPGYWAFVVMGVTAAVLLICCAIVLGRELPRELKRRFHT